MRGAPRRLVLASRSPRRIEALEALGLEFSVEVSGVEAELAPLPDPTDPIPIAAAKAEDIARRHPDAAVLAGDTIVVLGDAALGKPADGDDARAMLRRLRAREHVVRTGVALRGDGRLALGAVGCPLQMRDYGDEEIDRYVATGEPLDCAGAYDVHRLGGALVVEVRGCFSTVVGLPIVEAARLLTEAGIAPPRDPARACTELYGRECLALHEKTRGACVGNRT